MSPSRKLHCNRKEALLSPIFLSLLGLYSAAVLIGHFGVPSLGFGAAPEHRQLGSNDEDDCTEGPGPGPVVGWIFVIFYMFLAIAIVCDEFFVPCLEYIADDFQLSKDIAGATLMAAGGSAPELFMSGYGTLTKSTVGFSTIVGSAVFNVIFVIGVCALAAPGDLQLTWWPLFRDSLYYLISLIVLTVFFGVNSPQQIEWYEALILFLMYFCYVFMMSKNMKIFKWVMTTFMNKTPEQADEIVRLQDPEQHVHLAENKGNFFRAGILDLLTKGKDVGESAALLTVSNIKGDVFETFAEIDKDNDGHITLNEFAELLHSITGMSQDIVKVKEVFNSIDINSNGLVEKAEFEEWYLKAEKSLQDSVRETFNKFDETKDGMVDAEKIVKVLEGLGQKVEKKKKVLIMEQLGKKDGEGVTFEEFDAWYKNSLFWKHTKGRRLSSSPSATEAPVNALANTEAALGRPLGDPLDADPEDVTLETRKNNDEDEDEDEDPLSFPADGSLFAKFMWVLSLPLVLIFLYTIPDPEKKDQYFTKRFGQLPAAFAGFVGSIAWIGASTGLLAYAAELTCAQFGIPTVVSGLTFLAAGTSVPDLLSSVIVTKQGQGDMAVSSSIGSNIFDVLVGLPLPWLLYSVVKLEPVEVIASSLMLSITMLIIMLALVIGAVAGLGWKLTKKLGAIMFALYLVFLIVMLHPSNADWGSC